MQPAIFHERPTTAPPPVKKSIVVAMAEKYGVDSDKMLVTLKQTAFKQSADRQTGTIAEVTNEQMMMLLVVANEYNLNPFTREIYAFASKGGIVPIVSIDGWVRIVNEHKNFRGVAFEYGPPSEDAKHHGAPVWIQCTMYRDDREVPISIREYLVECYRNTDPWNTTTSRMLRHRSYMQCGRMAFGFALHDQDEAEVILNGEATRVPEPAKAIANFNQTVRPPIARESTREPDPPAAPPPAQAATTEPPAATVTPQASAAPEVVADTVENKLRAAHAARDIDVFDAHASLLPAIRDEVLRERATKVYKTLRAELTGKAK